MIDENINNSTILLEYHEKAVELFKQKKYKESLEFLDKALKNDPFNIEILCDKGNVCYAMGSEKYEDGYHETSKQIIEEAHYHFAQAHKYNNKFPRALNGLGKCSHFKARFNLIRQKIQFETALQWIDEAIRNDPSNTDSWQQKSVILLESGQLNEAKNAIDKAVDLDKNNAEIFHTKAVIYTHSKDYDEALKAIDSALKIEPKNARFWKTKGVIYYAQKKYIEAISFCNKAVELDPYFKKAIEDRNNAINRLKETGLSKADINKIVSTYQRTIQSFHKETQNALNYSITDIDSMNGYQFELFLQSLFSEMGYHVIHTPLAGDQGADLIVEKSGEKIVVQAKNQTSNVGNKAIQEAVAAIKYYNANRAMVVTNNNFTQSAIDLANLNQVELMDRGKLQHLIEILRIPKKHD